MEGGYIVPEPVQPPDAWRYCPLSDEPYSATGPNQPVFLPECGHTISRQAVANLIDSVPPGAASRVVCPFCNSIQPKMLKANECRPNWDTIQRLQVPTPRQRHLPPKPAPMPDIDPPGTPPADGVAEPVSPSADSGPSNPPFLDDSRKPLPAHMMYKHNTLLKQLCDSITCAPNGHVISMTGAVLATFTSPTPPPGMPDVEPIVSTEPISIKQSSLDDVISGTPRWVLAEPGKPVWVWDVACCDDVTVTNASIRLPKDGYLVLNSGCRGLTFQNIQFRGGVVLCIGDECSTTFQACTFEHCTVIVAGAAYATLVDSTCRGSAVATYARGAETRLTLECSDFRDCELAACAGDGAQLTMEECTCSRIAEGSLDVYGTGTSLQVITCKFKDCGTSQSPVATGHGTLGARSRATPAGRANSTKTFSSARSENSTTLGDGTDSVRGDSPARRGGSLRAGLRGALLYSANPAASAADCSEHLAPHSLFAPSGAGLEGDDSASLHAQEPAPPAVAVVHAGAVAEIQECDFMRTGRGMHVTGEGTAVRAAGCKFTELQGAAATAERGAIMSMQECTVSATNACTDSTVRIIHEETKATFGKCTLKGAHGPLATVAEGAFAELLDCKLSESSASVGVAVSGVNTRLEAERCFISRCHLASMHVQSGASLDIADCTMTGSELEGGIVVEGGDSEARVQGGCIEDNAASPVVVRSAAKATLIGIKLATNDTRADAAHALRQSTAAESQTCDTNALAQKAGATQSRQDNEGSVHSTRSTRTTRSRNLQKRRDASRTFQESDITEDEVSAGSGNFGLKQQAQKLAMHLKPGSFSAAAAMLAGGSPGGSAALRRSGHGQSSFIMSAHSSSLDNSPPFGDNDCEKDQEDSDPYGMQAPHGVHACGLSTSVQIQDCRIRAGKGCGILVNDRANLIAQACTIGDADGTKGGRNGVQVVEDITKAILKECVIRGSKDCGVLVRTGGLAELEQCKVRDTQTMHGIAALGSLARLEVTDSSIEKSADCGCVAEGGAVMHLERAQVLNTLGAHALGVLGSQTALSAHSVRINGAGGCGAYAGGQGGLRVSAASITGVTEQGIQVTGFRTRATLTDCDVGDCGKNGLLAEAGAQAAVTGCQFMHAKFHGVSIMGPETEVQVTECRMSDNERCGLIAWQGARASALRCEMDGARLNEESHGACAKGNGTVLTVTDCDMHENTGSGAAANFGAQLLIQNCAASDSRRYGVEASGKDTKVVVEGMMFDGNRKGNTDSRASAKIKMDKRDIDPRLMAIRGGVGPQRSGPIASGSTLGPRAPVAKSTISVTSRRGSAHSVRSAQLYSARSAWGGRTDSMAGVSDDSANSSRRFGAAWGAADRPGNQKPPSGARTLLPGGKEAKATVTRFLSKTLNALK